MPFFFICEPPGRMDFLPLADLAWESYLAMSTCLRQQVFPDGPGRTDDGSTLAPAHAELRRLLAARSPRNSRPSWDSAKSGRKVGRPIGKCS